VTSGIRHLEVNAACTFASRRFVGPHGWDDILMPRTLADRAMSFREAKGSIYQATVA
jgi:hypothetical protein